MVAVPVLHTAGPVAPDVYYTNPTQRIHWCQSCIQPQSSTLIDHAARRAYNPSTAPSGASRAYSPSPAQGWTMEQAVHTIPAQHPMVPVMHTAPIQHIDRPCSKPCIQSQHSIQRCQSCIQPQYNSRAVSTPSDLFPSAYSPQAAHTVTCTHRAYSPYSAQGVTCSCLTYSQQSAHTVTCSRLACSPYSAQRVTCSRLTYSP